MISTLSSVFGVLATACRDWLYGVMAYTVARRRERLESDLFLGRRPAAWCGW